MRSILLAVVSILAVPLIVGCQAANQGVAKVSNTLALGEIQNAAGFAEQNGDTDEAIALWTEYVERRPQQASAQYRLGRLLLAQGQAEEAADHLWIARDLKPGNLEYLDLLAEALFQAGERENMFQLLRDTLEEGGLAEGHLRMAKFSQRAGLIDEAQESLAVAAAIDGISDDRAHRALARLARQTGDTEAEINAWRTVLWFDAADTEASARLLELGEIPGPSLALPPRTAR
jgi:tetratricopeptide (TPR) repeat protein